MSLILDALRKLERERDAHEPGVLVVGSVKWGETSRARRLAMWAGAALVLALAVLLGWLLRRSPQAPAAAVEPQRVALPAPVASPSLAPSTPPVSPQPRPVAPATGAAVVAPPIRLSLPLRGERPQRSAEARAAPTPGPTPAATAEPAAAPLAGPAPAPAPAPELNLGPASAAPATASRAGAASGELRLSAISQRDGRPVALINDRLVFEGDSFEGVRILHIGEAEVEVEVHGQRQTLRF